MSIRNLLTIDQPLRGRSLATSGEDGLYIRASCPLQPACGIFLYCSRLETIAYEEAIETLYRCSIRRRWLDDDSASILGTSGAITARLMKMEKWRSGRFRTTPLVGMSVSAIDVLRALPRWRWETYSDLGRRTSAGDKHEVIVANVRWFRGRFRTVIGRAT